MGNRIPLLHPGRQTRHPLALSPLRPALDTPEGDVPASDEEFADAEAFAQKFTAAPGIHLPPGVVVDIGILRGPEGRAWAVIEANAAWTSGIYGCGASAILPVLRRVCVPTAALGAQDRQWANFR